MSRTTSLREMSAVTVKKMATDKIQEIKKYRRDSYKSAIRFLINNGRSENEWIFKKRIRNVSDAVNYLNKSDGWSTPRMDIAISKCRQKGRCEVLLDLATAKGSGKILLSVEDYQWLTAPLN